MIVHWNSAFAPVMTYGQSSSWFWTWIILLAQPRTDLTIKVLPPYHPNKGNITTYLVPTLSNNFHSAGKSGIYLLIDEQNDPYLFARNVEKLISDECGLPIAEYSAHHYLKEIREMRSTFDDLKLTGWKRIFTSGSELLSEKSTNQQTKTD